MIGDEVYCVKCNSKCLQNEKTIKDYIVVWCKKCGERWVKGDRERIPADMPKNEAKAVLSRRIEHMNLSDEMWRHIDDPRMWSGDGED